GGWHRPRRAGRAGVFARPPQLQEGVVAVSQDWPVAELDPVRRMRVIASSTPGVGYAEKLIPAPFDAVWDAASDLERELPRLLTDVRSFEITSARGERMTARARGWLGQRARFDVVLRPGWCVMQSRFLIGGVAAAPQGGGTPLAFLGGPPPPPPRPLHPPPPPPAPRPRRGAGRPARRRTGGVGAQPRVRGPGGAPPGAPRGVISGPRPPRRPTRGSSRPTATVPAPRRVPASRAGRSGAASRC